MDKNLVFLGALAVFQVLLIYYLFWHNGRRYHGSPMVWRSSVFFLAQLLVITSFVAGGWSEWADPWYGKSRYTAKYRFGKALEPASAPGDPALISLIQSQKPLLARPDLTDLNSFKVWQEQLRSRLLKVFDIAAPDVPTTVQVERIETVLIDNSIERTFLWFKSFDGTLIPAYLFVPKNAAQQPGVLVIPGHTSAEAEGIAQTAGLVASYQNRNALELAKSGYVTLTFELRGFGRLGASVNTDHDAVGYNAILSGSFYQAILIKDVKKAIDILQSIDGVDENRIGIAGASLGGEIARYYALLDSRIKAVSVHSYGGAIGKVSGRQSADYLREVTGQQTVNHLRGHYYCHYIPGQNKLFYMEDPYLLVVPRPLQLSASQEMHAVIQKAYDLFDASLNYYPFNAFDKHEYFVGEGIAFFDQVL